MKKASPDTYSTGEAFIFLMVLFCVIESDYNMVVCNCEDLTRKRAQMGLANYVNFS